MKKSLFLTVIILILAGSLPLSAQKKNLTRDDYAQWQNLSSYSISDDGTWVSWNITLVEGDDTLYVKSLSGDKSYKFVLATAPQFTNDSKWLAARINLSDKAQEKLREQKKPVRSKVLLLNLLTGDKRIFDEVSSFSFTRNSKHLIMNGYADEKSKTEDVYLYNLASGTLKNIGNVKEYSVNKRGDRLAYIIDAVGTMGNGVELFNLDNYAVRVIDNDTTTYTDLSWEKEGTGFTFLKAFADTAYVEKNYKLFAVRDIYGNINVKSFSPKGSSTIPSGMRVRETYTPGLSKDMKIAYFGVYKWTPKPARAKKSSADDKLPGVDIWHWQDDPIQPQQVKEYERSDKDFTYLFAWNIESGKVFRITDDEFEDASITGDGAHVLISTDKPYRPEFRLTHYDYQITDPTTGIRKPVISNFTSMYGSSPSGKYLVYFKDKNWWVYDINKDEHRNVTSGIQTELWNTRDDHPIEIKPPFGRVSWYENDSYMLVYDEYDTWKVNPAGGEPVRLTNGREEGIIFRTVRLNTEDNFFHNDEDLFFSASGDLTKKTGYYKVSPKGKVSELLFDDMAISGLEKSKNSDMFLYRAESYSDSPDLFATSGSFKKPVQVSATNPQQKDYFWGKSELVNYTNGDGRELQGALFYPANYEPGKKYPMIVYIYEILSTGVHRYSSPSLTSAYNTTNYTTNGYFVFMPDIVYKTNHPGESAANCVVPAVKKVISTGMIDEKKIGLIGHSWGAYQTSFIITQTDIFSAAVAGAPLIDMISMYNEIYWNSGSPNQQIFETSQGRLREPWWDLMDEYMANSAMFNAKKIVTPLLVTFGNQDGAVDWHQGIEMFTTMRRMGKEFILLVYDGENHSLRKKENMKDYSERVFQFFDYHLRGNEPAEWIKSGRTYLEKKELEELDRIKKESK